MARIFLGSSAGDDTGGPDEPISGFQAMTWQGWDGSEWDLLGLDAGLFLSGAIRGLGMPDVDHYRSQSPATAGSRWRGHRIPQREVFWPLYLFSDARGTAWVLRDRAFWQTMQPDKTGVWTVVRPSGMSRSIRLRFEGDGGHAYAFDPSQLGWALYAITLIAEDPYWTGTPVTREWSSDTGGAFFPGPPFTIGSSHTIDTATLTNLGDVESWPVWTLHGPFSSASVGVAGQIVTVPFSMGSGTSLVIDTDPRAQTAITNLGVDRTGELGAVGFTPVPAGTNVPLELAMTGAGKVAVSLSPRYYRAW